MTNDCTFEMTYSDGCFRLLDKKKEGELSGCARMIESDEIWCTHCDKCVDLFKLIISKGLILSFQMHGDKKCSSHKLTQYFKRSMTTNQCESNG